MSYSPDLFSSAMKMLSALGIVLGGMFIVFYFMKRFMKRNITGSKETLIRVLASSYVGMKKNISLIEIPGAVLVVGITNDNISLLSKIEDEEILEKFRLSNEQPIQMPFSDHLRKLSSRIKAKNKRK